MDMTCSRIHDMLALYAGGDLARAEDVREVESHLTECTACASELNALRRSMRALAVASASEEMLPAADPEYWHEVDSKLRERALGVDRLRLDRAAWRSVPALLAQAALILIVAGAVVWFASMQPAGIAPQESQASYVVLVNQPDRSSVEVSPVPSGGDVLYSDFNHVVRPDDVERFRDQVLPASYVEDISGPF
jgi:predicted anti-sigma-YlaC factor YlaD